MRRNKKKKIITLQKRRRERERGRKYIESNHGRKLSELGERSRHVDL